MVYGLLTVLNIKDMGFFIPHRYAARLERNKNASAHTRYLGHFRETTVHIYRATGDI